MTIDVTAEDNANGKRESPIGCPISLACRRTGLVDAEVGLSNVWVSDWKLGGAGRNFRLPSIAQQFIRDFDAGRPVAPFSFELEELP